MTHRHSQVDYLILGAGPGGLQLGYFLQRAGLSYLIVESGDTPGTFFKTFPRHRKLLSINKLHTGYRDPEINLRWDWNSLLSDDAALRFGNFSRRYFPAADDLVRYLCEFADRTKLALRCGTRIVEIRKDGEMFQLVDDAGQLYEGRRLVIATGLSRPYVPEIPGIELAERYVDVSVDPEDFVDQRVLIIGKGNSAFETAQNLVETARTIHLCSPNPVKMAWKSHYVGHLRAVNNDILDSYQLKSQNAVLDAVIDKIEERTSSRPQRRKTDTWVDFGDARFKVLVSYRHAGGEKEYLLYDRVIVCTGWSFDRSIFSEGCVPDAVINNSSVGWDPGKYPAMTAEYESTNIPGMFFAGALMASRDFKKSTSGFIHGFRYNARALFQILMSKYHEEPWPCREVDLDPDVLTEAVLGRVNRTSALWQQFGYLADVVVLQEGNARYYSDVPLDYLRSGGLKIRSPYYTVVLDYGAMGFDDPFAIERVHREDADHADASHFLHPIVRRFTASGMQVSEHHVIEDLASEWKERVHVEPLRQYFVHDLTSL